MPAASHRASLTLGNIASSTASHSASLSMGAVNTEKSEVAALTTPATIAATLAAYASGVTWSVPHSLGRCSSGASHPRLLSSRGQRSVRRTCRAPGSSGSARPTAPSAVVRLRSSPCRCEPAGPG
ncbi:hypothetical protein [Rhodococcus phage RGL3]|uniref:Uncharacterized protein n=1 Tax=Rhodococcus phage RGL3 TaxID=2922221 RepID=G9FHJ5_9CAUD|nr:hypothetical protein RoPhRGL3_gp03 [Rhodococcus phage RGL3]AEV52084.1 hypothetical protein [Rhodococcus phage RGL3]